MTRLVFLAAINLVIFILLRYFNILLAFLLGFATSPDFNASIYVDLIHLPSLIIHCLVLLLLALSNKQVIGENSTILDFDGTNVQKRKNSSPKSSLTITTKRLNNSSNSYIYYVLIIAILLLYIGSQSTVIPNHWLLPR